MPGAAQRESISFWLPGLRSSSNQETLCSCCWHTSTQFPSRTQRHNPHQNEWTLKYRKRYLWYSLSLMQNLLGSTRRITYFPDAPDEISSLLCMVAAYHYGLTWIIGGGGLLYWYEEVNFVWLCAFCLVFFWRRNSKKSPKDLLVSALVGSSTSCYCTKLAWKSLYCSCCVFLGWLCVALVQYFPCCEWCVATKRSTDENWGSDTFSLGANALSWQVFRHLVSVFLKEEQCQYEHTQTLKCWVWYFWIFRHTIPLWCYHAVQMHRFIFTEKKLWVVLHVTDLLSGSENWTKENCHFELVIENRGSSFLSNLKQAENRNIGIGHNEALLMIFFFLISKRKYSAIESWNFILGIA